MQQLVGIIVGVAGSYPVGQVHACAPASTIMRIRGRECLPIGDQIEPSGRIVGVLNHLVIRVCDRLPLSIRVIGIPYGRVEGIGDLAGTVEIVYFF